MSLVIGHIFTDSHIIFTSSPLPFVSQFIEVKHPLHTCMYVSTHIYKHTHINTHTMTNMGLRQSAKDDNALLGD
jgi:hypothetical protein